MIRLLAGIFFVASSLILAGRTLNKETSPEKRSLLQLLFIWMVIFAIVCIPMAYQLRPRFFVVVFALVYLFLGLWFQFIAERTGKRSPFIIAIIAFFLLFLNLQNTFAWFKEQELSQSKSFDTNLTLILKRKDGVTLGQMKRAVDHIIASANGRDISLFTKAEYYPPFIYLFNIKNQEVTRIKAKDPNTQPALFIILGADSDVSKIDKRLYEKMEITGKQQFGQLMVYAIILKDATNNLDQIKEETNNDENEDFQEEKNDDRLYWKDVL